MLGANGQGGEQKPMEITSYNKWGCLKNPGNPVSTPHLRKYARLEAYLIHLPICSWPTWRGTLVSLEAARGGGRTMTTQPRETMKECGRASTKVQGGRRAVLESHLQYRLEDVMGIQAWSESKTT